MVRSGKGGRDRVVPLGVVARSWIERYLREVRARLQAGLDRGELFPTDYGEPFGRNRLGDTIRRYVARAGLPGACHLYATWACRARDKETTAAPSRARQRCPSRRRIGGNRQRIVPALRRVDLLTAFACAGRQKGDAIRRHIAPVNAR